MYEYLNGTKLPQFHNDSSIINDEYTGGARGYIQKEDYDKMINEIYYSLPVPTTFVGYNFKPFAYWSSPAITHSVSMLGLSKYKLIKTNERKRQRNKK